MELPEFRPFKKIARLNREWLAHEKIDGTNAIVFVGEDGSVVAGSRNRWLTVDRDNYGFAKWVADNAEELRRLGPGYHYGEFWGAGVQSRYGLSEKRFSLFNVGRWADDAVRPKCCHVVPELARGLDVREVAERALARLRTEGSIAAPGFMNPEGIVLFHSASGTLLKVLLENDAAPKGAQATS